MSKGKIIIVGGGTFNYVSAHLALSAPSFGTVAKQIHKELLEQPNNDYDVELVLTKMADSSSKLSTNEDLDKQIDIWLEDENVKSIIMSAAICDFEVSKVMDDSLKFGSKTSQRLKTSNGDFNLTLTPSEKLISKIRIKRPDIFLVGFKTTTNETFEDQFSLSLKMMKSTKCNLVLSNDIALKRNMVLTAEETYYHLTNNRNEVVKGLVDMLLLRLKGTYERTKLVEYPNFNDFDKDTTFYKVLEFLVNNGGFISNNGNGFTNGHFCIKIKNEAMSGLELLHLSYFGVKVDTSKFCMLSSIRKRNHNKVFDEGMCYVFPNEDDSFTVLGDGKASVGARSQYILLGENEDMDIVIHTHNPLKEGSVIKSVPQYPFQCGSIECGMNTLNGIETYNASGDTIKAVYLEKHGANIMFKKDSNPDNIISFIKDNIKLGEKTK